MWFRVLGDWQENKVEDECRDKNAQLDKCSERLHGYILGFIMFGFSWSQGTFLSSIFSCLTEDSLAINTMVSLLIGLASIWCLVLHKHQCLLVMLINFQTEYRFSYSDCLCIGSIAHDKRVVWNPSKFKSPLRYFPRFTNWWSGIIKIYRFIGTFYNYTFLIKYII